MCMSPPWIRLVTVWIVANREEARQGGVPLIGIARLRAL